MRYINPRFTCLLTYLLVHWTVSAWLTARWRSCRLDFVSSCEEGRTVLRRWLPPAALERLCRGCRPAQFALRPQRVPPSYQCPGQSRLCYNKRSIKPEFHYDDVHVTSATSPRRGRDIVATRHGEVGRLPRVLSRGNRGVPRSATSPFIPVTSQWLFSSESRRIPSFCNSIILHQSDLSLTHFTSVSAILCYLTVNVNEKRKWWRHI